MKFSIVVPIYKTEQYLRQCIDSILKQNYIDYEIILVDDGSPDGCPKICDEYSNKNDCIKVIHKKNGGLSDARNTGVCKAKGEYIIFLDSDDFWEDNDFLYALNNKIEKTNADLILFGVIDLLRNLKRVVSVKYDEDYFDGKTKSEIINYLVETKQFPGASWQVAIKAEILEKNNISFPLGMISEDIDWLLNVFFNVNSISAINNVPYIYRKNRSGSITNDSGRKHVEDLLIIIERWMQKLEDPSVEFNLSRCLQKRLSYYYFTALIITGKLEKKDYIQIKASLKKNIYLLLKYNNSRFLILYRISEILGLRLTSKLIFYIYKLRGKWHE